MPGGFLVSVERRQSANEDFDFHADSFNILHVKLKFVAVCDSVLQSFARGGIASNGHRIVAQHEECVGIAADKYSAITTVVLIRDLKNVSEYDSDKEAEDVGINLLLGVNTGIVDALKGLTPPYCGAISRFHSAFNHLRTCLATRSFRCAFNESRNKMQAKGLSSFSHDASMMNIGFTTTHSDQCKLLLTGRKMKRLLKMSIFFLAVHD